MLFDSLFQNFVKWVLWAPTIVPTGTFGFYIFCLKNHKLSKTWELSRALELVPAECTHSNENLN